MQQFFRSLCMEKWKTPTTTTTTIEGTTAMYSIKIKLFQDSNS